MVTVPRPSEQDLAHYQKNVARMNMGAQIVNLSSESETPPPPASDLGNEYTPVWLGEDEARGADLPAGESLRLIALKDFHTVSKFILQNYGARGKVTVYGSETLQALNSRGWTELGSHNLGNTSDVSINFPSMNVHYVAMKFELERGGEIGGLGVFGEDTLDQASALFAENPEEIRALLAAGAKPIPFDFASLFTGSTITAISSGNPADSLLMIDDDTTTGFRFDPEENNVLMLDLRYDYMVDLLSVVLKAGPGTLELYAANSLPVDAAGLSAEDVGYNLPEDYFDTLEPIVTNKFDEPVERIQINLESLERRFYVLKWIPEDPNDPPLEIFEISVIGQVPEELSEVAFVSRSQFLSQTPTQQEPPDLEAPPVDNPDSFSD
ncbi:MAG: hypothetical protein Q7P63_05590 [Verrucomicrobiota bacterium JB022]|nr:hypothetical protein [Verrucomicrobiota bacterium JB022]